MPKREQFGLVKTSRISWINKAERILTVLGIVSKERNKIFNLPLPLEITGILDMLVSRKSAF